MSVITAVVGGTPFSLSLHPLELGKGKPGIPTTEQQLAYVIQKSTAALAVILQLVRGTDSLTVGNLRGWVFKSHFSAVITEDSRCLHQQGNV